MYTRFYLLQKFDETLYRSKQVKFTLLPLPPGFFLHPLYAVGIALLFWPVLFIISWGVEHTFYSSVSFGWDALGELVLPVGSAIFAATVFICRNPMHALLSLLGVFFCTVLMYLMAGIAFVGLVFLIVYVGAVAVLFLFVIMLLNVKSLTSNDRLVQHSSQVAAMVATAVLLQQLHGPVMGAVDQSIIGSISRDTSLTLSTADAVYTYVRFQAMDINALTGLYTVHAILFLVTTGILLAALLGAIILATVTTERATSIHDIRMYAKHDNANNAMLLVTVLSALIFGEQLLSLLELVSGDFSPILLSYSHIRLNFHGTRYMRNRKQGGLRKMHVLYADSRYSYLPRKRKRAQSRVLRIKYRPLSVKKARLFLATSRRLLLPAAIAPVLVRALIKRRTSVIARHRWLWRWRRDRATSLSRIGQSFFTYKKKRRGRVSRVYGAVRWCLNKYLYIVKYPLYVIQDFLSWARLGVHRLRMRFDSEYRIRQQTDLLNRISKLRQQIADDDAVLQRLGLPLSAPVNSFVFLPRTAPSGWRQKITQYLRVLGRFTQTKKRVLKTGRGETKHARVQLPPVRFRWSPLHYVQLRYRIRVSPYIVYAAWRVRAFCAFFFFYLAILPAISLVAGIFAVDSYTLFTQVRTIYQEMNDILPSMFSLAADGPVLLVFAMLVSPFAFLLLWTSTQGLYLAACSSLLAYDAVLMHGGELSDLEFYEARCEFWRKEGWFYIQRYLDEQAALALAYARRHPDGREDISISWELVEEEIWEWLHNPRSWERDITPFWYELYFVSPEWLARIIYIFFGCYFTVAHNVQRTQVYRCLSAWLRNQLSFIPDWYSALRHHISDVAQQSWDWWRLEGWSYFKPANDSLLYTVWRYTDPSAFVYAVLIVGTLYFTSCLILRLNWNKMYYGLPIRPPRLLVHVVFLVFFLYMLVFVYNYLAAPLHKILGNPDHYTYDLFGTYATGHTTYFEETWERFKLVYLFIPYNWAFIYLLNLLPVEQWWQPVNRTRRWVDRHSPLVLRCYFNTCQAWHDFFVDDARDLFWDELEDIWPVTAVSLYPQTRADAEEQALIDYRQEQAKFLEFELIVYRRVITYYDINTWKKYRRVRFPAAFSSEKLHENSFISK